MARQFSLSVLFRAVDRISAPMRRIGRSMRQLSAPVDRLATRFRHLGDSAVKAGKKMVEVGKSLSLKLTAPIVAFGTLAVRSAVTFQAAMNFVGAVTKATEKDFQRLEKVAMNLGRTTQFSATQAAEAMKFLGLSGLSTNEIMEALPKTLELAASAQLDLSSAASIVTGVVKGMGLEFSDLGRINDVLVNAFTNSKTNLVDLGEGMSKVGSTADTFGFKLEETVAMLGLLAEREFGGALGGTALRRIISLLASQTPKASKAFKRFGIEVKNADGTIKSMAGVLAEFEGAMERGATETQIGQLALLAFGQRGGPAFLAALKAGSKRLIEFTELLKEQGTATRISEAQMKGLPGTMKRLVSVWESLQLAIVKSGLGAWIEKMIGSLSNFIEKLVQTDPKLLAIATVIAGLVAAIGPLIAALGFLAIGIGAFLKIGAVAVVLAKLVLGFKALAAAISLAFFALQLFAVTNPIIAIGVALVAAGLLVWKYWEPIKEFFLSLPELLSNAWKSISNLFSSFGRMVGGVLPDFLKGPLGIAVEGKKTDFSMGKLKPAEGEKSKTDVNVRIVTDKGSRAQIEDVKSRGAADVNISTIGYVGAMP